MCNMLLSNFSKGSFLGFLKLSQFQYICDDTMPIGFAILVINVNHKFWYTSLHINNKLFILHSMLAYESDTILGSLHPALELWCCSRAGISRRCKSFAYVLFQTQTSSFQLNTIQISTQILNLSLLQLKK